MDSSPLPVLKEKELQLLAALSGGATYAEIAFRLNISVGYITANLKYSMLEKLGVETVNRAVYIGAKRNLV